MKYEINVAEIRSTRVVIEAESSAEAEQIAEDMYYDGKISVSEEPVIQTEDLNR